MLSYATLGLTRGQLGGTIAVGCSLATASNRRQLLQCCYWQLNVCCADVYLTVTDSCNVTVMASRLQKKIPHKSAFSVIIHNTCEFCLHQLVLLITL